MVGTRNSLLCCAVSVWLALLGGEASGQASFSGYIEYQRRQESREEQVNSEVDLITFRADGSTPLVEPWIADLTAGIGLTFSETSQDDLSQSGSDVTGKTRLRLLPRSKFPFEAFAEKRSSRTDGELVGPDYTQTVFGFTQTLLRSVGERYTFNYRQTNREDERADLLAQQTKTEDEFFGLTISRSLTHHQLDLQSDHDRISRDEPVQFDRRNVNVLRHRYTPDAALSVDNLVSVVDSNVQTDALSATTSQSQLSSNLFWRPETAKPLLVSGSALASGFDNTTGTANTENQLLLFSANGHYQASPALGLRLSGSYSDNQTQVAESKSTVIRVSTNYAPGEIELGTWNYSYAIGADVGSRHETQAGDVDEAIATLRHGATRYSGGTGSSRSVSLFQEMSALRDTDDREEDRLIHTASADWSKPGATQSAFLRVLASDNRRLDGEQSVFQIVNAQVSGTRQVSRQSSWTGSLTAQQSRSLTEIDNRSPWTRSASSDITYRHEKVFGIPLLRFSSQLRLLSDDLVVATNDRQPTERRETASWINRLDYIVGRTQFTLRASVSEVDRRRYSLLHFQVRRFFGRLPG